MNAPVLVIEIKRKAVVIGPWQAYRQVHLRELWITGDEFLYVVRAMLPDYYVDGYVVEYDAAWGLHQIEGAVDTVEAVLG